MLLILVLPLHLFGSGLSSSTLMLVAFVFTLLQESQDKFEVQIHEAKCKAVMRCDHVSGSCSCKPYVKLKFLSCAGRLVMQQTKQ